VGDELCGTAGRDVEDPSTGDSVAMVPDASREDVDRAVQAARRAQPGWQALGIDGRSELFSSSLI